MYQQAFTTKVIQPEPSRPPFYSAAHHSRDKRAAHLQDWVGLQQAVFHQLNLLAGRTRDGVVLQDLLGGLGLSRAALPRDEDALVLSFRPQGAVRVVRHCVAVQVEEEARVCGWRTSVTFESRTPSLGECSTK